VKALRAVDGTIYDWDWDKLIPKDAGIDHAYIENIIKQINGGMYQHLFLNAIGLMSGLTFLDIGANLGLVSIYAAPFCKQVIAMEPAPNVYPIMQELVRPFKNITPFSWALETYDGQKQMFINDINFTASSTVNTYGTPQLVTCTKLSSFLKFTNLTHVDVCKIDIEGSEGESLDYYEINNAKDIIDKWFIEVHNCPKTDWQHKLGTIVGNLARCGYHKQKIDGMAIIASK